MRLEAFLKPHPSDQNVPDVDLKVRANSVDSNLELIYELSGKDFSRVRVPAANHGWSRQNELWKSTCFECFFKEPEASSYWELNFCPSQLWNAYHFQSYRDKCVEEKAITLLEPFITRTSDSFEMAVTVCLGDSFKGVDAALFCISLTAILETDTKTVSHWALQHCATEPDFHLAESYFCN